MGKNKKGITLVALAITIVIMIILVGVSIYLTISDNGLIQKATEANKNQTLTELYEITDSELSYLKIAGKAEGKEEISIEKLYNRKGFSEHYEIRDGGIWDKSRKTEIMKKSEFDEYVKNKLKSDDSDDIHTDPPIVNSVINEDTVITGIGIKNSIINVDIAGNKYTGTVNMQGEFSINIPKQISGTIIKVTQKEENKLQSAEIKIEVRKTRLNKLTINSVNSNDTYISGKAEKYAQIKLVISGREFTRKF